MSWDNELVGRVLTASPVVDGHNDLPMALRGGTGYSVAGLDTGMPQFHTDIPRLRAGGVGAQFWSVYVDSWISEPEAVVATMEQVDAVYRLAAAYPADLTIAYTADDVERAVGSGRIASLLGIEGGHSLACSLGVLRAFARLGVRYVTLTHNDNTSWADSATDAPGVGGLNDVGRAIVAEMNRIGVLVDLSHVAATTQHAALDVTTAPVIFSHSSARAVTENPRNVADDVLLRLRDNGGVIQLTFVPPFVSAESAAWTAAQRAERVRLGLPLLPWTWPRAPHPGESPAATARENADQDKANQDKADEELRSWLADNPRPTATIGQVADHIDHAREVAGVDHIGLGGDYDGTDDLPAGLTDVSGYPRLLAELADRGWSESDLRALTGRNVLRVLREAERVADEPLWPPTPAR